MQPTGARLVSLNYEMLASVSDTIKSEMHLQISVFFYRIIHGLVAVPLSSYIQLNTHISRYCNSMTFRKVHATRDYSEPLEFRTTN